MKTYTFLFLSVVLLAACSAPAPTPNTPFLQPTPSQPVDLLPSATLRASATATPRASNTPKLLTQTITLTLPPHVLALQDPPLSGEDVNALQEKLLELGYAEVGQADGVFSTQTDAAVRHFQYRNGLPVTGVVDEETNALLRSTTAVYYLPMIPFPGVTLAEGSATCDEHNLKERLASLGFMEPGLADWQLDTIGAPTKKAMTAFFKANGLPNDGVMDLSDWSVLYAPGVVDAQGNGFVPVPPEEVWQTSIYAVPGEPFDLAWDGERLWVAAYDAAYGIPSIYILDPAAPPYAALSAVRVGACAGMYQAYAPYQARNIVFARNRIWALLTDMDSGEQFIQGIGAQNGLISKPMAVGDCGQGCFDSSALGFDGSTLWASANNQAYALNANSGATLFSVEAGWLMHGEMVFDGQDCMYANGESGVTAFSIRGAPCGSYDYGFSEGALATDGARVWNASYGSLTSYDPKTHQYSDPIGIADGNAALAFDGQRLWIAAGDSLIGMDVKTGGIGDPLPLAGTPSAMLYDGARLWVALSDGAVQVIDPQGYVIPLITPVPTRTFTPRPANTATPTITPTSAFVRDLYLTTPNLNGEDVLQLQQRLETLGYNVGVADGVFGPLTDAAVRLFQERNGLTVDGWVGQITWNALFSPDAKGP